MQTPLHHANFEAFTAVIFQVEVLWVVMSGLYGQTQETTNVGVYHRFVSRKHSLDTQVGISNQGCVCHLLALFIVKLKV
jgi:hypothetical protein